MNLIQLHDSKIAEHVRTFILNQLSPQTQRAYHADLRQFFEAVSVPSVEAVTAEMVVLYRMQLKGVYKVATVNRKLAALKGMFQYLRSVNAISVDPTEFVKLYPQDDNSNTAALTDNEVVNLLEAVDVTTDAGRLHHAVLSVFLYLGLRGSELRRLTNGDLVGNTLSIIGKGERRRILPVPDSVMYSVERYTRARSTVLQNQNEATPLFTASNSDGSKSLSHETITKMIQRYAKLAGITTKISPHSLRATAVSNALENKATTIQVQYMGGWQSPAMVARYDKRRQILKNSAVFSVHYKGDPK